MRFNQKGNFMQIDSRKSKLKLNMNHNQESATANFKKTNYQKPTKIK